MKLLYLVHDFLPEHVGGTEVHTAELAQAMLRRGHEVVIACTERDLARADGEVAVREHEGLRVLEAAHAREYASAEDTWTESGPREVFRRLLARERPDVLHVQHFAQWGTGVLECARELGVPALVTLHDYHLLCANACLLRADGSSCAGDCAQCLQGLPAPRSGAGAEGLARAADARRHKHAADLRLADLVIAPSQFLAELVLARGLCLPERTLVLGSGVDGPWRDPVPSDPRRPLRLAYAGGIYAAKGVHVLIDAFTRLPEGVATLDVHGVLEWFPAYAGHLRALAGARADVRFHGRFAPAELGHLLDLADVLVVPSLWNENRPLTIQAAFRRGICVVASDLGGMAELVSEGRGGALFPHGDARALAELLQALAQDRPRVLALARARPDLPTLDEVADRHGELYRAALSRPRPSPGESTRYPRTP